ncbi:putative F-box/FBD/LRR-repeat protein At3g49030 [Lolium perenne]|uniref:putative F-box/FBD/LRR-repeat protein At3g49030 n=1 Tax=Lolium perenne TaxID=4522 RepID=UPI0021EA482A
MDGEIPAKRPKPSDGGDSGSEDRLSDLPEDLLLRILDNIRDVPVAVRTSVLSSRWRRLWRLLPVLNFPFPTDPQHIRLALQSHEAPVIWILQAVVLDGNPDSMAPWLLIAAPRLFGRLSLTSRASQNGSEEDMADERGAFELPCFQNAASIRLELGPLGVSMPPLGVFARLNDLSLVCVQLHGPCMLGDLVSSPRCPVLRKLIIKEASGLGNLAIHSDSLIAISLKDVHLHPADALGPGQVTIESNSLLQMELMSVHSLQQLTITAAALKCIYVDSCFANYRARASRHNQPVANIYAPRLKSLYWHDAYDPSSTQFGNIENLETLGAYLFQVYGRDNYAPNNYILRLLRRFQLILSLRFLLLYQPVSSFFMSVMPSL